MLAFVAPCSGLNGTVQAPPSKNYTARFLLAAALAEGESLVVNPAGNDDARVMRACLEALGAEIRPSGADLLVRGFGAHPEPRAELEVGNAGAVLRFLMAAACLGEEISFHTPYPDSLGRRPNGDLLGALESLGAEVESRDGRLPITIRGKRLPGGAVSLSGQVSSQYTSALLFLAPLLPRGLVIQVTGGLRSAAAVRTTLDVLRRVGIEAGADWERLVFNVPGGQAYRPGRYVVDGDYPAAVAIIAASALLPGKVRVGGLLPDAQGERAALRELASMGADLRETPDGVEIAGGRVLHGVEADGDGFIDAVLSLATAAGFAEGQSVLRRVGHLRFKESDRLGDFAREMASAGLEMIPEGENLLIKGRPGGIDGGVRVSAHQDHRLVMALATAGLRSRRGLVVSGAEHVSKSYPGFFQDLELLGASVKFEREQQDFAEE